MLKFITGNKSKIKEAQSILAPNKILPVNIDLTEIQDIDPRKIIAHKLKEALKFQKGPLFVDDSSLFLGCFNFKLPGPFIKWFNEYVGMQGIADLAKNMKNNKAKAVTLIGYAENPRKILFFEGVLKGKIVPPKGGYGFGYDPIFIPEGKKQTLAEIKASGDFSYSPRAVALNKLRRYLKKDQTVRNTK